MKYNQRIYPQCWILLLPLACLAGGCAHSTYYASDLPEEFQAPVVPSAQALDLTRFAKLATTTDVVERGDVIQVSITTGLERYRAPTWNLRVDDDGVVMIPIVGPVRVAGLALSQADQAIYDAAVSRGFFRNPNVAVTRLARRESRVVVSGAVKRPGSYDLPATSCDVLSAIVAAGGLNPNADTIVEIRQPNLSDPNANRGTEQLASYQRQLENGAPQRTIRLDLSQPDQVRDWDVALADGAVITVPERPENVIAVMGKVKRPGQFELVDGQQMRFLDAVAKAGGKTTLMTDKAYVVRQAEGQTEPVLIRVSIRDAKANPDANLVLAPGDVVSVEETPLTVGVETLSRLIRVSVSSRFVF